MANTVLGDVVHPELMTLLKMIDDVDGKKLACDFPGCGKSHTDITIRIAKPAIDLKFCSDEHRDEARRRWGLLN